MSWSNAYPRGTRRYFEALVAAARRIDSSTRITSTRRSRSEQERLYRRWLAGQSKYPVARPGTSKHETGRAIDIIAKPETLRRLGAAWEKLGPSFRWGGRFNDDIHFEL